ncbi:MAG: ribonuclease [Oscillospiraceae bacterium]|nr:ribonuclease [Oscillospiraceae bacterium]
MSAALLLSSCNAKEAASSDGLQEPSKTTQQTQKQEASQSEEVFDDTGSSQDTETLPEDKPNDDLPTYGEYYYDLTNVVLYIEVYGELPPNYITKSKARELGWEGGSVENYKPGAAIGGDRFGNYEGLLPEAPGRSYTECDIDTNGYGSRGSRRLVFSNDGLYFYTSDHYESFSEVTVTKDYEVIR